jgi:hypothetical protein
MNAGLILFEHFSVSIRQTICHWFRQPHLLRSSPLMIVYFLRLLELERCSLCLVSSFLQ